MTLSFASSAPLAAGTLALMLALAQPALAQDRSVGGAAVIYAPAYPGSDDYRFLPVPVIEGKRGRFYANPRKGVGYTVVKQRKTTVLAGLTYVSGYRRQDAPQGIGRLSGGVGARIAIETKSQGLRASLAATQTLSGGVDGALVEAAGSRTFRVTPRLGLAPGVSATWADRRYTERFYGVSAAQAATSGLPTYRPGGGLRDVAATLTATYRLSDRTLITATGAMTAVVGDARDSPIVSDPTQPSAILSIAYMF